MLRHRFAHRITRAISLLLCLALLSQASPAPAIAGSPAHSPELRSDPPTTTCDLYPIALHTASLAGVSAGSIVADIVNGTQPGTFGWLSWTGHPSEPALVASLTPPGDSASYIMDPEI